MNVTAPETLRGQIKDAAKALSLLTAGNATLTLVSKVSGTRLTFKASKARSSDAGSPRFVSLLNGCDNESDFVFLGTIFGDATGKAETYRHGKRSSITPAAPSARAFDYFFRHLMAGDIPEQLEVWHEGRCCRCGRKLTVPASIETGLGPECAGKGA